MKWYYPDNWCYVSSFALLVLCTVGRQVIYNWHIVKCFRAAPFTDRRGVKACQHRASRSLSWLACCAAVMNRLFTTSVILTKTKCCLCGIYGYVSKGSTAEMNSYGFWIILYALLLWKGQSYITSRERYCSGSCLPGKQGKHFNKKF